MKTLKITIAALALAVAFSAPVMAQQPKAEKKTTTKEKEHTCNPGCTDKKHAYLHGEKGHKCDDNCKKSQETKKA